jgi:hypothetical protein
MSRRMLQHTASYGAINLNYDWSRTKSPVALKLPGGTAAHSAQSAAVLSEVRPSGKLDAPCDERGDKGGTVESTSPSREGVERLQ